MSKVNFMLRWNEASLFRKNHPRHIYKLGRLLRAWNGVLEEYEGAWRKVKILPYIYNEQAEIGLLATAARDTQSLPFIEFSTQKIINGKRYVGRADLEIYWTEKLDWCLGIEAKPASISCSSRRRNKDLFFIIQEPLEEARKCVKTIKKHYVDCMALVIGLLNHASDDFNRKQFCKDLFDAAWRLKADFCVIHFCDDEIWKNSWDKDCPGIALIGKLYGKRASKRGKAPLSFFPLSFDRRGGQGVR